MLFTSVLKSKFHEKYQCDLFGRVGSQMCLCEHGKKYGNIPIIFLFHATHLQNIPDVDYVASRKV